MKQHEKPKGGNGGVPTGLKPRKRAGGTESAKN